MEEGDKGKEKPQTVEENTREGREVYVEMVRRGKEVVAVGEKDEGEEALRC